jgi:hypothetical protein
MWSVKGMKIAGCEAEQSPVIVASRVGVDVSKKGAKTQIV